MTVLKILYQDEDLVIVSKPEKMLTHRTEIANGEPSSRCSFYAIRSADA